MTLANKVGDLYHKNLYRHISRCTAGIADLTDYAITDTVLGGSLFSTELTVALLGSMAYQMAFNRGEMPHLSDFKGAGELILTLGITYGTNFIRTPLEKKLGLDENVALNEVEEFEKTISRLNDLSHSPKLSFYQVNDLVNISLDSLVERIEGYKVEHSKKTKKSIFSKYLLRKGIGGLMNPFLQEVVVTSELFPESIAHEKAHMVGYAREHEAQFAGYLSMLLSEEPSLEYLAYAERLNLLIRQYSGSWTDSSEKERIEVIENKLRQGGLNERTLGEIVRRESYLDEELSKNSWYQTKVSDIEHLIRSGMLKMLGQTNLKTAYVEKPLKLMSSYDKFLTKNKVVA